MTINTDEVWARIQGCAGAEFRQLRGKPFTYGVSGRSINLHTTNRSISRTAIEEAVGLCPLADTTPVQHLMAAPSYIYAILMDHRIRGGDW